MSRIIRPNRSSDIRINRLFKRALLFSLITCALVPAAGFFWNASYGQSSSDFAFSIATADKRTDIPVQWVSSGGGVVAYGAGPHVDFALVDDPFSPVARLAFDGAISEALILGSYALLSQEGLGLRLVDLSVPSTPVDLGFYPLSGTVFHLATWGNLLFVSGIDPGIQIFEVSFSMEQNSPLTLISKGIISVPDPILAIAASEWKLYAATGEEVKVYDVSDLFLTLEVDSLPIALPARSLAVNGETLFVAAGIEGLLMIDVSTPGNPVLRATHPVQSEFLYLAGRKVYLATGDGGLHLLNVGPIGAATINVQVAPGGSFTFSPNPVNVNAGDIVKWTWMSSNHTVTSGTNCTFNGPGPNTFDSGVLSTSSTFQFTFNTAGSFPYFCAIHCSFGMVGTVNVASSGPGINISVTPGSVNFGNVNVGSTSDQTITIANQASSTAALTGTVGDLSAPFSVVNGGGAFNLTPGQSTTVTVRFSPTAAGAASGSLSIMHNATNQTNPTTVALSGTGVSPKIPVVSISPASIDFGNVKVKKSKTASLKVTNSGNANLTMTSTITGTDASMFTITGGSGSKIIKPGKSLTIRVAFKPTSTGAKNAALEISSNDPATPIVDISLKGSGQ